MIAVPPRKHASRRNLMAAGAAAGALAIAFGVGIAQAADPKLDLADANLEKAAVLLQESQAGVVSDKQQKTFDKAIARAIADVEAARAELAAAKAAVDNP
jgi:hypothetical protein